MSLTLSLPSSNACGSIDGASERECKPEHLAPALRSLLENRLDALLPADDPLNPLPSAMRYLVLAPGKRLRPLMTMLVTLQLGGDRYAALDAACAVEMVHAASLILDDLPCMDDAQKRRGLLTVHKMFGESTAILAAISLLSRAFEIVASDANLLEETRSLVTQKLAGAIGHEGLSMGQVRDLLQTHQRADEAEQTNFQKTAALFIASAEIGAMIALADKRSIQHAGTFARHLGLAYQIYDDLYDTQLVDSASKDTGNDAEKPTVIAFVGSEQARKMADSHVRKARVAARQIGQWHDPLLYFIEYELKLS